MKASHNRGVNTWEVWLEPDGTQAKYTLTKLWQDSKGYKIMNTKRYLEFFDEVCKEPGVYQLSIGFNKGGHTTILQRFENGELRYIEPQEDNSFGSGRERYNLQYLASQGAGKSHICRGDNEN